MREQSSILRAEGVAHDRADMIYAIGDFLGGNYPVRDGYLGSYIRRGVGRIRVVLTHNVWAGDYCRINRAEVQP